MPRSAVTWRLPLSCSCCRLDHRRWRNTFYAYVSDTDLVRPIGKPHFVLLITTLRQARILRTECLPLDPPLHANAGQQHSHLYIKLEGRSRRALGRPVLPSPCDSTVRRVSVCDNPGVPHLPLGCGVDVRELWMDLTQIMRDHRDAEFLEYLRKILQSPGMAKRSHEAYGAATVRRRLCSIAKNDAGAGVVGVSPIGFEGK